MRILILLVAAALSLNVAAAGPEGVARDYSKAVVKKDWISAVAYFDDASLAKMRRLFGRLLFDERGEALKGEVFPGHSDDDIAALSDPAFAARIIGWQMARSTAQAGPIEFRGATFLGTVSESNDLVHVVQRQNAAIDGRVLETVDIISLRRTDGAWHVTLPSQIDFMLRMLEER